MAVVINLGGEGEVVGAVDVNAFIASQMRDRQFVRRRGPAMVIASSAHAIGLASGCADEIVARDFPIQNDEFVVDNAGSRAPIALLSSEVVRVLKEGGRAALGCASCDREALRGSLEQAGLKRTAVTGNRVEGWKL